MATSRFSAGLRFAGRSSILCFAAGMLGWGAAVVLADGPDTQPAYIALHSPASQPAGTVDIRKTLAFLASDALEGRGAGTPGNDLASGYIAGTFAQLGLQPPTGWETYFQPFSITTSTTVDPKTTLAAGAGKDWLADLKRPIKLTDDYQPLSFSREGTFDAPVIFAGYGITAKHHGYDDYAGLDVKGKVVLVMRFEPIDAGGKSIFTEKKDDWSDNAAIPTKAKNAADHGAVALLLVNPPTRQGDVIAPFARQMQFDRAGIPVVQLKQPLANSLLSTGGAGSLADLEKKIDSAAAPASVELTDVGVKADVAFQRTEKAARNVAAVLPGTGELADEYVVIGSHYDHLGRGGPGSLAPFSKEIHHGADDNASGTTAMLKLADELSKQISTRSGSRRSILFIAFSGEELGLLGSAYFVNHNPIAEGKTAAMLNLDMVGRVNENMLQVGGTGTAPSFEKFLKAADEGSPLKLSMNSKGGMGPSDHTSFATKQIPVLFFFSGLHKDYHRPSDTADKINYQGMEDVIRLVGKVTDDVAKMPKEAYVSKFDSQGLSIMGSVGDGGGPKVSLGIVPDYTDDSVKGVRITGTSPGSAAERAGLKGGDTIIGWGEQRLDNLTEMMGFLMKGKPGDKVTLKVIRDGKPIELEATLSEKKG